MKMDRRRFLKRAIAVAVGGVAAGGAYPFLEAKWCRVLETTSVVPNLPKPFRGTRVALLTDIHHGPFVPLVYIRHIVEMTNALKPDLVLLGGDYVHRSSRFIEPGIDALAKLEAGLGRFAVLGNHDHCESAPASSRALAKANIIRTDNTGFWVEQDGSRLRVCGVGDLWCDRQYPAAAFGDATDTDAVLMLSHNPDFAETLTDRRVGLMLSGHTHGGQVVVPGYGAPVVPSRYGQKYLHGLVDAPHCRVFVSRGVGTVSPPVRLCCRPEIVLLTLV
jgi:predicted MPP superfamily phosphohydrolase